METKWNRANILWLICGNNINKPAYAQGSLEYDKRTNKDGIYQTNQSQPPQNPKISNPNWALWLMETHCLFPFTIAPMVIYAHL